MAKKAKDPKLLPTFTFPELFERYAKHFDSKSDGKVMCLSASDKWMERAELFGKKLTLTDTGVCFLKFKARAINFQNYEKFLKDLAIYKGLDYNEIVTKLVACGLPDQPEEKKPAVRRRLI